MTHPLRLHVLWLAAFGLAAFGLAACSDVTPKSSPKSAAAAAVDGDAGTVTNVDQKSSFCAVYRGKPAENLRARGFGYRPNPAPSLPAQVSEDTVSNAIQPRDETAESSLTERSSASVPSPHSASAAAKREDSLWVCTETLFQDAEIPSVAVAGVWSVPAMPQSWVWWHPSASAAKADFKLLSEDGRVWPSRLESTWYDDQFTMELSALQPMERDGQVVLRAVLTRVAAAPDVERSVRSSTRRIRVNPEMAPPR